MTNCLGCGQRDPTRGIMGGMTPLPPSWRSGRAEGSSRGRPRDSDLTARLLDVTVSLLAEQDWSTVTVDAVAARAQAGKAGIYRRWPSVKALMADALSQLTLIAPDEDTGTTTGDFRALLEPWTEPVGPGERAAGALVGACRHDPGIYMAMHKVVVAPLTDRLDRLTARHQTPAAQRVLLAKIVQALCWERYLTAEPLTAADAQQLIDTVLVPLLHSPQGSQCTEQCAQRRAPLAPGPDRHRSIGGVNDAQTMVGRLAAVDVAPLREEDTGAPSPRASWQLAMTPVTDLPAALSRIEQLEQALVSNRAISMAVGMLMERHDVDADAALAELRHISQSLNVRLAAVATMLLEGRT